MSLPKPKVAKWGYTYKELKTFMSGYKLKKFLKYIRGKFVGYWKKETIYYRWDVKNFLRGS